MSDPVEEMAREADAVEHMVNIMLAVNTGTDAPVADKILQAGDYARALVAAGYARRDDEPTDAELEAMCRAYDGEDAAQSGEMSPWDVPPRDPEWEESRKEAMRAAIRARKTP